MGLDVYLKWFDDFEATQVLEAKGKQLEEDIWSKYGQYDQLAEEQKKEARMQIEAMHIELGLTSTGIARQGVKSIRLDSTKYPNHLFKIGYFRSSYNSSGIDNVLMMLFGDDVRLASIFGNTEDGYQTVDWLAVKNSARDVLNRLKIFLKEDGCYSATACRYNEFSGSPEECPIKDVGAAIQEFKGEFERVSEGQVFNQDRFKVMQIGFSTLNLNEAEETTASDALKTFLQMRDIGIKFCNDDAVFATPLIVRAVITGVQSDGHNIYPCYYFVVDKGEGENLKSGGEDYFSYSSARGHFYFGKPVRVVGVVNGFCKRFFVDEFVPMVFFIKEEDHGYEWYKEALEIVIETCDYVLSQPDPEKYYLYWSR